MGSHLVKVTLPVEFLQWAQVLVDVPLMALGVEPRPMLPLQMEVTTTWLRDFAVVNRLIPWCIGQAKLVFA
jgi:hypothetical protein